MTEPAEGLVRMKSRLTLDSFFKINHSNGVYCSSVGGVLPAIKLTTPFLQDEPWEGFLAPVCDDSRSFLDARPMESLHCGFLSRFICFSTPALHTDLHIARGLTELWWPGANCPKPSMFCSFLIVQQVDANLEEAEASDEISLASRKHSSIIAWVMEISAGWVFVK